MSPVWFQAADYGVFVVPTIQFFADDNIDRRLPQGVRPNPWISNSTFSTADLVGSSEKVIEELTAFVLSVLPSAKDHRSESLASAPRETKLNSRANPATLDEKNWVDLHRKYEHKIEKADGSLGNPITLRELSKNKVLTYHHRAGLNKILSEVLRQSCP